MNTEVDFGASLKQEISWSLDEVFILSFFRALFNSVTSIETM
jgi:hypothetical protein